MALGGVAGLAACTGQVGGGGGRPASGMAGAGVTSGGAGTSGGVPGAAGTSPTCQAALVIPPRLARVGDAQIANAIADVFGPTALAAVTVADPRTRDFIATQDTLNSAVLDKYVQTAEGAMNALADDALAQLGGCTLATFNDACAGKTIAAVAQKFYRRPVATDELASLMTVYTETSAFGVPVATRAALRAVLTAPATIYRTELGTPVGDGTTVLTSSEMASELSFMLADTIPDEGLLAAAKADKLATPADIDAQVTRLLATPRAQANLTRVMLANYGVGSLFGTSKDAMLFPAYTPALETSLYTETRLFVDDVLWHGKLPQLLSSRRTFIDQNLATLYGVPYPGPAGGGFQSYTFAPNTRAGLLTQGSILAIAANPDNTSVVHRGLFVHGKIMCRGVVPPPASLASQINALSTANITEKKKAEVRAMTSPCNGCHLAFDQYGLTMEHYDAIGRYRQAYPDGTPIDSSTMLPDDAGGAAVAGVTDMSDVLAGSPTFATCVAEQLTGYGVGFELDSSAAADCGIAKAYQAFARAGTGTFTDLVRAITTSDALRIRTVKANP